MGAFKAGVQIVTFDEKDNIDALNSSLKDSGARGFIFSPQTHIIRIAPHGATLVAIAH